MSRSNSATKKQNLHSRNQHREGYDFTQLCRLYPALNPYVTENHKRKTINFSDPKAVLALNSALLKTYYRIDLWQIPDGYLCPPIPGRVDYIHYLAQLLESLDPKLDHRSVTALDIGTGASCIYPILGQRCYQWRFLASDIDPISVKCAQEITKLNNGLSKFIKVKLQKNSNHFFNSIINPTQKVDITLCNPPFHSSLAQALQGNQRKQVNLDKSRAKRNPKSTSQLHSQSASLNFGGQKAELFCEGGELKFIKDMIAQSREYQAQVLYFTCLVSKGDNLNLLKKALKAVKAKDIQIIKMSQGQKVSRFIAWSFHDETARKQWFSTTE